MKTSNPNVAAQNYARKYIVKKYRQEYDMIYRAEVIRLGGKLAPTKEEKIEKLKAAIRQLEETE